MIRLKPCAVKIIVCIKPTPDSETKITIQNLDAVPLTFNPFDGYAVEAALRQKDALGATVTVLSIGDQNATDVLKHALAMGADDAILINDPALADLDTQGVAHVLAAAARKLGDVGLLIFGCQTLDYGTGLMPAQTARVLDWPLLSLAGSIRVSAGKISVERSFEEGRQIVRAGLPAVLSVTPGIGEPRYPSFIGIRRAAKASITCWSLADLGLDAPAPVVRRVGLFAPRRDLPCEFIDGASPEEIAEKLTAKILAENVL